MKKLTIAFLALLISLYLFSQSNKSISIIPVPVSMQVANGNFTLIKKSIIAWSGRGNE